MVECEAVKLSIESGKYFHGNMEKFFSPRPHSPFCSSLFSCWCMTKFSSSGACYFPRAPLDFKENNWQDFKQRISLLFISIFPTPFATSIERWRLLLMFLFFRCFYFLFILIWPAASCTAQPPGKSA